MYLSPVAPSLGVIADPVIRRVILRGGTYVLGDVMMFDFGFSNAATTNFIAGDPNSCLVNVIAPTSGGIKFYPHVVLLEGGVDGQKVRALLSGDVDAYVLKASGNIAKGDLLVPTSSNNLSPDHTGGERALGVAREAVTAPTVRTLKRVTFNGMRGPTLLAP